MECLGVLPHLLICSIPSLLILGYPVQVEEEEEGKGGGGGGGGEEEGREEGKGGGGEEEEEGRDEGKGGGRGGGRLGEMKARKIYNR